VPTFDELLLPTVNALIKLGGSGTIDEIYDTVVDQLRLSNEITDVPHTKTGTSEVEYRLAWSRTYLKKYGLITNSARGVWSLSWPSIAPSKYSPAEIVKFVRGADKAKKPFAVNARTNEEEVEDDEIAQTSRWEAQLREALLALEPSAFERLIQRLLCESGFVQVEVTGNSGDGGIDGVGIARVNGFLSFHVLFQCKRYQGFVTVGSSLSTVAGSPVSMLSTESLRWR
jgi:restriction system protein